MNVKKLKNLGLSATVLGTTALGTVMGGCSYTPSKYDGVILAPDGTAMRDYQNEQGVSALAGAHALSSDQEIASIDFTTDIRETDKDWWGDELGAAIGTVLNAGTDKLFGGYSHVGEVTIPVIGVTEEGAWMIPPGYHGGHLDELGDGGGELRVDGLFFTRDAASIQALLELKRALAVDQIRGLQSAVSVTDKGNVHTKNDVILQNKEIEVYQDRTRGRYSLRIDGRGIYINGRRAHKFRNRLNLRRSYSFVGTFAQAKYHMDEVQAITAMGPNGQEVTISAVDQVIAARTTEIDRVNRLKLLLQDRANRRDDNLNGMPLNPWETKEGSSRHDPSPSFREYEGRSSAGSLREAWKELRERRAAEKNRER